METHLTSHATHPLQFAARDVRPILTVMGGIIVASAIGMGIYLLGYASMGLVLAVSA